MDASVATYSAVNQALSKQFQNGVEAALAMPGMFKSLYDIVPSNSRQNVYRWMNQVPGFREWVSGSERVYRNVETADYAITNKKYESTISIALDDVDDDLLDTYAPLAKNLGKAAVRLQDQLVGELLAGAFATTKTYDGEYWCSNSHTIGQSTIDNLTTGALAYSTFATAYTQLRSFTFKADKDSAAVPCNVNSKLFLVVPPALELTARDIVKLDTRNEATYATKNPYYGLADVIVNGYASSTTAWLLIAVNDFAPIFYQERMKPKLEEKTPANSDTAFNRDQWIWGAKARGAALATFPWQVVGSAG